MGIKYPLCVFTGGFSWGPCGSIVLLDSGTITIVNAKVEVQQKARPSLVAIQIIMYGKNTGHSKYERFHGMLKKVP